MKIIDTPTSPRNARPYEEHHYCLGLGSNILPEKNLPAAVKMLRQFMVIEAVSTAWETPAVDSVGPDFLNAAVLVRITCSMERLKSQFLRRIETFLGRHRTRDKNAPRSIDIDVILCDMELLQPQIWTRAYLAVPIAELLPGITHPETQETLAQVAQRLAQNVSIKPRPEVLPGNPPV
jgi:2-amino-4-hydroxy-6-hydroxymethyldihydropteridine diphosphokinase